MLQLLHAAALPGLVSRWTEDQFVETLARSLSASNVDARSKIEEHTGANLSSINKAQRIILTRLQPTTLVTAEWLHEKFGVDIRCYRLQLSREENGDDYLTCSCIYPPLKIATLTRGADGRTARTTVAWESWDVALEDVQSTALIDYVRAELSRKQEDRLSERQIIYRVHGQRRFYLNCRINFAYVWQRGRFKDDLEYWRKVLSEPERAQPVARQRELRFYLTTPADFTAFGKAMRSDLANVDFVEPDEPSLDQP